jgi:hypothetical protein
MDRPRRSDAIHPSPQKKLYLLGRQFPTSRVSINELETNYKEKIMSNGLSMGFIKWREILADRNYWHATCGS